LGGEQSGHMIFSQYNTTGDGLGSALCLLQVVQESHRPLSQLAGIMQKLPQILCNVPVSQKDGWQNDADIMAVYEKVRTELGQKGRVVLRPSGTEQLIRVMVEGQDMQQLQSLINELVLVIKQKRGQ